MVKPNHAENVKLRLQELQREQALRRRPPPSIRRETPINYPQPRYERLFERDFLCGNCGRLGEDPLDERQLPAIYDSKTIEELRIFGSVTGWSECRGCGAIGVLWVRVAD